MVARMNAERQELQSVTLAEADCDGAHDHVAVRDDGLLHIVGLIVSFGNIGAAGEQCAFKEITDEWELHDVMLDPEFFAVIFGEFQLLFVFLSVIERNRLHPALAVFHEEMQQRDRVHAARDDLHAGRVFRREQRVVREAGENLLD